MQSCCVSRETEGTREAEGGRETEEGRETYRGRETEVGHSVTRFQTRRGLGVSESGSVWGDTSFMLEIAPFPLSL